MKYITEFKQYVKYKLHEKIKENNLATIEKDTSLKIDEKLITDFKAEFEKIMKDYDYLYK
jgi:hypothetical protein